MRLSFYGVLWLSLSMWPGIAGAQEVSASEPAPSPTEDGVIDMEAVVVAGVQPGPGLWKVRHGDHLLYILGTQSPLPKNMTWRSDEVTRVLELADEVLGPPGVAVNADVGFFRSLTMLPSALKAAKNPDGQKLEDVLPADLYARWSVLKQRYMGRDGGVEKKRPLLAVYELYGKALSRSGLQGGGRVVTPVIEDALKARGMKRTPTQLKITLEDPKGALADFRKETLKPQDLVCFSRTLDLIEHELPQSAISARAWAVGDWTAIRNNARADEQSACDSAWFDTETARKHGVRDVEARARAKWLETAEASLRKNRITFATMSVWTLVKPDGYLEALRAKGYEVEAPE